MLNRFSQWILSTGAFSSIYYHSAQLSSGRVRQTNFLFFGFTGFILCTIILLERKAIIYWIVLFINYHHYFHPIDQRANSSINLWLSVVYSFFRFLTRGEQNKRPCERSVWIRIYNERILSRDVIHNVFFFLLSVFPLMRFARLSF